MMPHSRVSIWYLILLTRSSASAFDNFMFGNVSWQHFMNFSTQHNASISATTRPTMADILPHPNAMITPTTSTGMLTSTGNLETATITSNISSMMINDTHKKTSNLTTSPRLWTNNTQVWNDTSASISATPKLTYTKDPVVLCEEQSRSWYSASTSHKENQISLNETFMSRIVYETTTSYILTGTCDVTCGSICYAEPTTIDTSLVVITSYDYYRAYWGSIIPFTAPKPTCTIPKESCRSMIKSYASATRHWATADDWSPFPEWPFCDGPQPDCHILVSGKARLFYWPVAETASRDMCTDYPGGDVAFDPNIYYRNIKAYNEPQPYTEIRTGSPVVTSGYTFYPGNVYLSIPSIFRKEWFPETISNGRVKLDISTGEIYENVMITMASSQLISHRWDYRLTQIGGLFGGNHVNYADFNIPVPWSAYKGLTDPACTETSSPGDNVTVSTCQEFVYSGQYHPIFHLPTVVRLLAPDWHSCILGGMVTDPPVALSSVLNFLPTMTEVTATTSAQEGIRPELVPLPTAPVHGGEVGEPPNDWGSVNIEQSRPTHAPDIGPHIPQAESSNGVHATRTQGPKPADTDGLIIGPDQAAITIGASTFPVVLPGQNVGGLVLGPGTTLKPGDAGITINAVSLSAGADGIVLSEEGSKATTIPFTAQPAITVGPSTLPLIFVPSPSGGGLVLDPGTTLRIGDPGVTINGVSLSADVNGIVVAEGAGKSRTVPFPVQQSITVGSSTFPIIFGPDHTGVGVVLGPGTTLKLGDPGAAINGVSLSVGVDGVVVAEDGGKTRTIPVAAQPAITVGPFTFPIVKGSVETEGGLVLAPGRTLRAGNSGVSIEGVSVSVANNGIVFDDGGGQGAKTIPFVAETEKDPMLSAIAIGPSTVSIFFDSTQHEGLALNSRTTLREGGPGAIVNGVSTSVGANGIVISESGKGRLRTIPFESDGSAMSIASTRSRARSQSGIQGNRVTALSKTKTGDKHGGIATAKSKTKKADGAKVETKQRSQLGGWIMMTLSVGFIWIYL